MKDLVTPKDFFLGKTDSPMRIEIEAEVESKVFTYALAFELPATFREMRVLEERLLVGGVPHFTRQRAQVTLAKAGVAQSGIAAFGVDWHLVALPIVQELSSLDPLSVFKQWLSRMILLQPVPQQIIGDSSDSTLVPNVDAANFGDWFTGLLASAPSAYSAIDKYLKPLMPDLKDIKNPIVGPDARSIEVHFEIGHASYRMPFKELSDGEKCLMICAVVVAANSAYGPLCCFWDEPENHIGISEVGHLVVALRKAFGKQGQFIATTHNPEAIRKFSDENTFVLHRKSHLEPTVIQKLGDLQVHGDLVNALIRGDVEA